MKAHAEVRKMTGVWNPQNLEINNVPRNGRVDRITSVEGESRRQGRLREREGNRAPSRGSALSHYRSHLVLTYVRGMPANRDHNEH